MRKNMLISIISLVIAFTMMPFPGSAQVPKMINYQGYLTDTAGNPVNGSVSMTFAIYDVATGGSALWSETRTVTVDNGRYSVNLGAVNPLNLAEAKPYYLGVQVGADPEMTPRKELTSAMYSLFVDGITVKDGNVGIGTTNPEKKLEINVDHQDGMRIVSSGIPRLELDSYDGTSYKGNWVMFTNPDNGAFGIFDDNGGGNRFTISSDGNIGIGTTNPTLAKLIVNEGVGNTAAIFGNTLPLTAVFSWPTLGFNTYYNNGWKVFTGGKYTGAISFNPDAGDMKFHTGNAPANAGDSATLSERLTIKQNGNVGIGTNDFSTFRSGLKPKFYIKDSGWVGAFIESDSHGAILGLTNSQRSFEIASRGVGLEIHDNTVGKRRVSIDSSGTFRVEGKMIAQEVVVKSNVWADHVFDEELLPLSEVEQYINAHKHLPGIPSEQEVLKNGLSLGEMQAKQMGEIEKLMRYVIELKKENDQLKARLSALESLSE